MPRNYCFGLGGAVFAYFYTHVPMGIQPKDRAGGTGEMERWQRHFGERMDVYKGG